ncbi:MAG: hypothetical protein WDZ29_03385 [Balneolaceae bacterium]
MNKYLLLHLVWLLPAYFITMAVYQGLVYHGIGQTWSQGENSMATVTEFEFKQIAAQTNGYVDLRFYVSSGETIERRLSLPVQMARSIMEVELVPVRYLESSFQEVVMVPTYSLQRNMVRVNLAVTLFGFLVTVWLAIKARKRALRIRYEGEEAIEIERLDTKTEGA